MKRIVLLVACAAVGASQASVVLETARLRFELDDDASARSLVLKETGEELLDAKTRVPFFTVTQERPYNNEIKLVEMNARTVYPANRIEVEKSGGGGDGTMRLIVGFKTAPYEAVVSVKATDDYIAFTLKDFRVEFEDYRLAPLSAKTLAFTAPPAVEFRLAQLPVRARKNFGQWINAVWDDRAAVAVVATSPQAIVSATPTGNGRILSADAVKSARLKGTGAALVAAAGETAFLDRMEALERDFGLPPGVANRRNPLVNASVYWTRDLGPTNVDEHIATAKRGGFRLMLCYYSCFYERCGDYPLKPEYPNGLADVKAMLAKVRAAGIVPGLHVLHTYVATNSSFVAGGTADRRLGLKRRFTLARPLGADDTEIFVDEDPSESETDPRARKLRFGGELMTYAGFTSERPYRFTGVMRGYAATRRTVHPCGEIGGLLDVSEFGGIDFYLSQDSDLQDIIADTFAALWRQSMGFVYFDGSEGVRPPFAYHVPNAQYRVWKKLDPVPFLGEGAAKAHFGWHMLSGANAFDVFPPERFNEAIEKYPAAEAPLMRQDFSRVNFGWWMIWNPGDVLPDGSVTVGCQPDMWEYGTSRAAGWDAPVTVQMRLWKLNNHPRKDDLLEVMRRWEDVRTKKWLTPEQKAALRVTGSEHHLYVNSKGDYELVPIRRLPTSDPDVRAWYFTCSEGNRVVYHHARGAQDYELDFGNGRKQTVRAAGRAYLKTDLGFDDFRSAVWRPFR